MSTRRDVLAQVVSMGGALAFGADPAAGTGRSMAPGPLRILILGGTGNIGPYHVSAALARGHRVSVFSRGLSEAHLPAGVERLIGDRNGDLKSIRNRDWDAVIDIATFGPGWVRTLGRALSGRVRHYTFISTISVYDDAPANAITDETSKVLAYHGSKDPYSITAEGPDYGAVKVLCEEEAEKQFPGRAFIVRPGYIGGPGDTHDVLVYWPLRMQHGGEALAAGNPSTAVQFIDVRDMAAWIVRTIERSGTGVYNAIGPAAPATVGDVVEAARQSASAPAKVTWVPSSWLSAQKGREAFSTLLFWEFNTGYLTRISNARALAQGLTTRALSVTLSDTLRWYRTGHPQDELVTGPRPKANGSGFERGHLSWASYLDRERAMITAWRASRSKAS